MPPRRVLPRSNLGAASAGGRGRNNRVGAGRGRGGGERPSPSADDRDDGSVVDDDEGGDNTATISRAVSQAVYHDTNHATNIHLSQSSPPPVNHEANPTTNGSTTNASIAAHVTSTTKLTKQKRILTAVYPANSGEQVRVRVKIGNQFWEPRRMKTAGVASSKEAADGDDIQHHPHGGHHQHQHQHQKQKQQHSQQEEEEEEEEEEAMASRLPKRKRNTVFSSLSPAVIKATSIARAEAALAASQVPQLGSSKGSSSARGHGLAHHGSLAGGAAAAAHPQPPPGASSNTPLTATGANGTFPSSSISPHAPTAAMATATPPTRTSATAIATSPKQSEHINPAAIAAENAVLSTGKVPEEFLGYDGNLFYCKLCLGVGEVVCCDGCPYVFHPHCIPEGLSKTSLEMDDDPWFCHDCVTTKGMLGKSICGAGGSPSGRKTKARRKLQQQQQQHHHRQHHQEHHHKLEEGEEGEENSLHSSLASPPHFGKKQRKIKNELMQDGTITTPTARQKRCSECRKKANGHHPVVPCSGRNCKLFVHTPMCPGREHEKKDRLLRPMCTSCKATRMLSSENGYDYDDDDDDGELTMEDDEHDDEHDDDDDDDVPLEVLDSKGSNGTGRGGKGSGRGGRGRGGRGSGRGGRGRGRGGRSGSSGGRGRGGNAIGDDDSLTSGHGSDEGDDDYRTAIAASLSSSKRKRAPSSASLSSDDEHFPEKRKPGRPKRPGSMTPEEKKRLKKLELKEAEERANQDAEDEIDEKKRRKKKKLVVSSSDGHSGLHLFSESISPTASIPATPTIGHRTNSNLESHAKAMTSSGFQSPHREDGVDEEEGPASLAYIEKPLSSTPAYFFFLLNNRAAIEKSLFRKSRMFRGMPKGLSRNEKIAQEGAAIWMDLSPKDKKEYIEYAIKDFEKRVIAWKEKEVIEGMMEAMEEEGTIEEESESEEKQPVTVTLEDDVYIANSRARLLRPSKVKCQSIKMSEKENTSNRILLELLNDVRFRPLPLVSTTRAAEDVISFRPNSKGTIQQFTVQGPIETSVGDECLGCSRGWSHFCPVLKRPLPVSEHRCKLQPPLSSLTATRVGLGLKVNLPHDKDNGESSATEMITERHPNIGIGASDDGISNLCPNYQPRDSFYLTDPSLRNDDTSTFIESAMILKTMKINSDCQHPSSTIGNDDSSTSLPAAGKKLSRGLLPLRGRKKSDKTTTSDRCDGDANGLPTNTSHAEETNQRFKCRCGTIQLNPSGCIPCRRAQLVSEMAKRKICSPYSVEEDFLKKNSSIDSPEYSAGFVKPMNIMLGRTQIGVSDTGNGEASRLNDGHDKIVGNLLTQKNWKPNVILPHTPKLLPTPRPIGQLSDRSSESEDSSSDESVSSASSSSSKLTKKVDNSHQNDAQGLDDVKASESGISIGASPSQELDDGRRSRSLSRSCTHPKHLESETTDSPDRQALAMKQKESAADLSRKCLAIACCGVLVGMIRRDPLRLFAEPVPSNVDEYHKVIKDPTDFRTIREKVLASEYTSLGAFINDARRLCINACVFNAADSLYAKTAKQIFDSLKVMQKRAQNWMAALKNSHATSFILNDGGGADNETHALKALKATWPGAVELLYNGSWLRKLLESDFVRTRENETAYYGTLTIRRVAKAAEASLALASDVGGVQRPVVRRSHIEDELLRRHIDHEVSLLAGPIQLKDEPDWREDQILKLLKKVQKRRIDSRMSSESGCARCDSIRSDDETKIAVSSMRRKFKKKAHEAKARVAASRLPQSTGLASRNARLKADEEHVEANKPIELINSIDTEKVSVRGSLIHGWGLFADYPFQKDEVVAEYIGEYISNAVADAREKYYRKRRIQDYQFRVDGNLVIDATLKGGHARYINHGCNPNCVAKIVNGKPPNQHLKRVLIVSQREIQAMEELSYDYQFPLELNLDLRIPCSCGSKHCRGYMNWDIPEKASVRGKIKSIDRIEKDGSKGRMNKRTSM